MSQSNVCGSQQQVAAFLQHYMSPWCPGCCQGSGSQRAGFRREAYEYGRWCKRNLCWLLQAGLREGEQQRQSVREDQMSVFMLAPCRWGAAPGRQAIDPLKNAPLFPLRAMAPRG
jgi:hypothetical protein